MLRHYVAVALRNTVRTKLYAAISVAGLAIGFGAAALIGFYVHDELTFDRWIPNHERIYQVSPTLSTGLPAGAGPSDLGQWLAADYPQLQAVTRLFRATAFFAPSNRADVRFNEQITWADANVFDVFRFPVAAGSLDGALTQPDSLVLTRRVAEKYFGAAGTAVGETLLMNGMQPMTVTAVIENLPSNTHLSYLTVIGAGHAPYSPSALQDRTPMPVFGGKLWNSATYALLAPGERLEPVRDGIATMIDRHAPAVLGGTLKASEVWKLAIRPIRTIHLSAGSTVDPESQRYGPVYTVTAIGVLIVLVASINFVNLLTALGLRRALEVGVRKAIGAQRGDLFAQFMTESFLYVTLGAAAGLGLARLALGPLNVFLGRTIDFSTFADWRVGAGALGFLAATALLAGVYPSLVLSAFRPATVTKGARGGRGQGVVRQSLVVVQFAILIALLSCFLVIGPFARVSTQNELWADYGYLSCMDGIALGCLVAMISAKIKLGDKANLALRIVGTLLCLLITVFRGTASRLALYKVGLDVTVLGIGTALLLIALQTTFEASGSRLDPSPASGNKFAAARKAIFRSTSFLRWFGRNSYEVYLTHMLVVWPMVLLFLYFRLSINWSPLWFLMTTALAGIYGYLVARFYSEPLNYWLRVKSMPAKGKTAAVAGD